MQLRNTNSISSMLIKMSASVLDAMKVIDQGGAQIAMVVDDERKLRGVVTDGDLRRAILGGARLDECIERFVKGECHFVDAGTSRNEALDLMKCFHIEQLPVVTKAGEICGLHLLNELIQPSNLPNAAVILAGGKGSRLGDLTKSMPKPMIVVAGRPILERIVLHLVGAGIRRIFLSVNYLAEQIEAHFGNGTRYGCEIFYLREDKPLGTGGPLSLLHEGLHRNEPVLVMNGDLVTDFDAAGMLVDHRRGKHEITIGARMYTHVVPFGCLRTDGNRVLAVDEKPTHRELINAGVYVVSPELVAQVPNEFYPITRLVDLALEQKRLVGTFAIDNWIDVGQPEQLAEALGNV